MATSELIRELLNIAVYSERIYRSVRRVVEILQDELDVLDGGLDFELEM